MYILFFWFSLRKSATNLQYRYVDILIEWEINIQKEMNIQCHETFMSTIKTDLSSSKYRVKTPLPPCAMASPRQSESVDG